MKIEMAENSSAISRMEKLNFEEKLQDFACLSVCLSLCVLQNYSYRSYLSENQTCKKWRL